MSDPRNPFTPGEPTDVVPEVSSLPEGVQPDLIDPAAQAAADDGVWRKVPKAPASVIDTHPVEQAGEVVSPPPIPQAVKVGGAVAIAVLLMLGALLGMSLGAPPPAAPTTPTPSVKEWALTPPASVGTWVRGDQQSQAPIKEGGPTVVRADYANGTDKLYLLLSRPETDIAAYLSDAGVDSTHAIGSSTCGVSVDTNKPVCVRIADSTAIMLVGVSDQSQVTIASLVGDFYDALAA